MERDCEEWGVGENESKRDRNAAKIREREKGEEI